MSRGKVAKGILETTGVKSDEARKFLFKMEGHCLYCGSSKCQKGNSGFYLKNPEVLLEAVKPYYRMWQIGKGRRLMMADPQSVRRSRDAENAFRCRFGHNPRVDVE